MGRLRCIAVRCSGCSPGCRLAGLPPAWCRSPHNPRTANLPHLHPASLPHLPSWTCRGSCGSTPVANTRRTEMLRAAALSSRAVAGFLPLTCRGGEVGSGKVGASGGQRLALAELLGAHALPQGTVRAFGGWRQALAELLGAGKVAQGIVHASRGQHGSRQQLTADAIIMCNAHLHSSVAGLCFQHAPPAGRAWSARSTWSGPEVRRGGEARPHARPPSRPPPPHACPCLRVGPYEVDLGVRGRVEGRLKRGKTT